MADRRITSRLNMANAVKQVCDDNTSVVATVPAFVVLVSGLGTRITALRAQMKKLNTKKKAGDAENKAYWKEELSELLAIICGSGISYAKKKGDIVLKNEFDFPVSEFKDMRDTELIEMAQSIIDLQATVAAGLIDYGITPAFMTDVTAALQNFEMANPKPIANVSTTAADRDLTLKMAFSLSDYVLQDMMKAALIYKRLNPTFFQSLDNASLIRDNGLRHEDDEDMEETDMPVEKAAIEAPTQLDLTVKKEAQDAPNTSDILSNNVQELNIETPALPEPSMNGH